MPKTDPFAVFSTQIVMIPAQHILDWSWLILWDMVKSLVEDGLDALTKSTDALEVFFFVLFKVIDWTRHGSDASA